jgi:signal transduction histidine kinase
MEVEVISESFADDVPDAHRTCVFRVVQEALRNASRHSGAAHALVYIEDVKERLRLRIEDDGKGFVPSLETGLGLLSMQERVVNLSGTIRVDSSPGRGAVITVELPLPANSSARHTPPGETLVHEIRPFRTA